MYSKLLRYFYTILNLKFSQIVFQVYYRLLPTQYLDKKKVEFSISPLKFLRYFEKEKIIEQNKFEFLNLSKTFEKDIDWNFQGFGKLWNYNLQYFDYLFQPDLSIEAKIILLKSFYGSATEKKVPLEPYPVSLRAMNSMKFYSQNHIEDVELMNYLYHELEFLHNRYEFHLLGNHLLENAFAMLMGGFFFQKANWSEKAKKILKMELNEQILNDGGHFEQSPMYHNIILFRILELIDWYKNDGNWNDNFLEFLMNKASSMICWLKNISFENGEIPHFNDSTNGIAFNTQILFQYGEELQVPIYNLPLSDSGYRKYKTQLYECIIDVGGIQPSYQPGHSHSDSFSFWLNSKGSPLVVEVGTSTYENNATRKFERSTAAHNTVTLGQQNQSQVWGAFRVGKQIQVKIEKESPTLILASHNGYSSLHKRLWEFKEKEILIKDSITPSHNQSALFHLHLADNIEIRIRNNQEVDLNNNIQLKFSNAKAILKKEYKMTTGFNKFVTAKKLEIEFKNQLETQIKFL